MLKTEFKVVLSKKAEKFLEKLPKDYRSKVMQRMKEISKDPYYGDCQKMSGFSGVFRSRVGIYRIIYKVINEEIIVEVINISHRQNTY